MAEADRPVPGQNPDQDGQGEHENLFGGPEATAEETPEIEHNLRAAGSDQSNVASFFLASLACWLLG